MQSVFVIVGKYDNPVYEVEFNREASAREDSAHLNQFILHASLDMVDEVVWAKTDMYLKTVDRFHNWSISAFVTAGHARFLLLHELRGQDDAIRAFFTDVYELYVKVLLNPFYMHDSEIKSIKFDARIKRVKKLMSPVPA